MGFFAASFRCSESPAITGSLICCSKNFLISPSAVTPVTSARLSPPRYPPMTNPWIFSSLATPYMPCVLVRKAFVCCSEKGQRPTLTTRRGSTLQHTEAWFVLVSRALPSPPHFSCRPRSPLLSFFPSSLPALLRTWSSFTQAVPARPHPTASLRESRPACVEVTMRFQNGN